MSKEFCIKKIIHNNKLENFTFLFHHVCILLPTQTQVAETKL